MTTERVLRLLGLLQGRTVRTGPELAALLSVTERTVRRDVQRLRELGYSVDAVQGVGGGYRLGAGRAVPPLTLDVDEAVALVACLRMGALGGQDGIGEAALRALGKLDAVLPRAARAQVAALGQATVALPGTRPDVAWEELATLARATRDRTRVRFTYTGASGGTPRERRVEPAHLATQGSHWYLQGFDLDRDDWRVFRLDRMTELHATTFRFRPRPAPELGEHLRRPDRWPCVGVVRLGASAEEVAARVPPAHRIELRPDGGSCMLTSSAPSWDDLAWHLAWVARDLDCSLTVLDAEPLRAALHALGTQLLEHTD